MKSLRISIFIIFRFKVADGCGDSYDLRILTVELTNQTVANFEKEFTNNTIRPYMWITIYSDGKKANKLGRSVYFFHLSLVLFCLQIDGRE